MTTVLHLIHMKVLLRSVREDSVRIFLVDFYFGDQLQLKFRTGNMIGCLDIWLAIHGVIGPRNVKGWVDIGLEDWWQVGTTEVKMELIVFLALEEVVLIRRVRANTKHISCTNGILMSWKYPKIEMTTFFLSSMLKKDIFCCNSFYQ